LRKTAKRENGPNNNALGILARPVSVSKKKKIGE